MADFSRAWNEASPAGTDNASEGDDAIRNLKVEISDRLKTLIYGFIAGEDTDAPGCKNLIFKQQAAAPDTPSADHISVYALDDGANCGMYAKNEDGYATQLLKKIGSTFAIPSGAYGADSIDADDIRLANNTYLTARNQAGDGDINIVVVDTANAIRLGHVTYPQYKVIVPDGSKTNTSAAPTTAAELANKKYVDDEVAAISDPAYAGGESHTFDGGLIMKMGYEANAGTTTPVAFAEAFPNGIVSVTVIPKDTIAGADHAPTVNNLLVGGFDIYNVNGLGFYTGYYWTAIGH